MRYDIICLYYEKYIYIYIERDVVYNLSGLVLCLFSTNPYLFYDNLIKKFQNIAQTVNYH